jgi:hypothetical protein
LWPRRETQKARVGPLSSLGGGSPPSVRGPSPALGCRRPHSSRNPREGPLCLRAVLTPFNRFSGSQQQSGGWLGDAWCCGGENRGGKIMSGRKAPTLGSCQGGRFQEEKRRAEINDQLILASTTGDVARIKSLLTMDADINVTKDNVSHHPPTPRVNELRDSQLLRLTPCRAALPLRSLSAHCLHLAVATE